MWIWISGAIVPAGKLTYECKKLAEGACTVSSLIMYDILALN